MSLTNLLLVDIYFYLFIYLFQFIDFLSFFKIFWLCWVFVAACGLSLLAVRGGYSSLWCAGFSLQWLLLLQSTGCRHAGFSSCGVQAQQLQCVGSRARGLQQLWHVGFSSCGSQALERRLSSCGARAQLLHSMWDLPGPTVSRLEPVSPVLAGGFPTTVPPGKSWQTFKLLPVSCSSKQYSNELPIFFFFTF